MSEKIVQLNEEVIKGQLKELVRGSVEETLNGLLEAQIVPFSEMILCPAKTRSVEDSPSPASA